MSVGHPHEPVQHRDGKPPWCPTCGLTAGGSVPQSRFPSAAPGTGRGPDVNRDQALPPRGGAGGSQPGSVAEVNITVTPPVEVDPALLARHHTNEDGRRFRA